MSSPQLLDVTGRRRSPAAMPGHNAGRRAPQQGDGLSGRSANGRRDRRRDAQDPVRSARCQAPGADRRAVARRATDPGSSVIDRVRSRSATRRDSRSRREGQQAPGGRDGLLGVERSPRSMARPQGRAASRRALLRDRRAHARAALVGDRRTRGTASIRARRGCSAQVRAPSAEACARCRARP